jgi:hypothetical protein
MVVIGTTELVLDDDGFAGLVLGHKVDGKGSRCFHTSRRSTRLIRSIAPWSIRLLFLLTA